ncbi:MAG: GAF domain-containing sensor histidine kinase [Anaerolineae bacterium]|nr:GAF domain-containing sensor histidine kinase [Anaerolineae bacterium]MCI0607933.1 GAF domain-containing sensor histidine kinase [Anaerolineae bacterium]
MATNERIDHLERLLEVVRGLTTAPDLEAFLQSIINEAAELTNSELASILEYDETAEELRFLAMQWFQRDVLRPLGVPLEDSAAGWVYRKGQPLIIQDVKVDKRHFKVIDRVTNHVTHSLAAVPLMVRGEVVGVLEALNKKDDAHYTEEDLTILATLGALAAQAMKNATLQRKVKAAGIELAELERLKTDFIAITSHELRTPLGLILGHATFLRELAGAEYGEQLDTIIRNASKLKDIVENLSDVDNIQNGAARVRSHKVSLAKLAEDVILTFQDEANSRNITLKLERGESPYEIEADGVKLSIALSNLVKNAIQYTDSGSRVLIKLEEDSGYFKVTVMDNGIGIPAKDLPRVFERFFQVETHLTRRYGGMGLGLAVAKAMIELHGGRIWVESEVGKGSTFTFLLPMNQTQEQASSSNPFIE